MESVILDEVRKLTKVLGFQTNEQTNNNVREKNSLSLHQKVTEHTNMTRDTFSEHQPILDQNKIGKINLSSNVVSVENERTHSKKDRYNK